MFCMVNVSCDHDDSDTDGEGRFILRAVFIPLPPFLTPQLAVNLIEF